MTLIEPGRICVIIRGSDAGKEAIITSVIDKNYVTISGPNVKQRRMNVMHLDPTPQKSSVDSFPKKEDKKIVSDEKTADQPDKSKKITRFTKRHKM